jgi:hypothetical protein
MTSEHLVWLTDLPYDPQEFLVQQASTVNGHKPGKCSIAQQHVVELQCTGKALVTEHDPRMDPFN